MWSIITIVALVVARVLDVDEILDVHTESTD